MALAVGGFAAGILVVHLPLAGAAAAVSTVDLIHRHLLVSLDEIRKNFAFADEFQSRYSKTVTEPSGRSS